MVQIFREHDGFDGFATLKLAKSSYFVKVSIRHLNYRIQFQGRRYFSLDLIRKLSGG
jgi:hypothetical protein